MSGRDERGHFSHVVGFDDAPFAHARKGDVLVVGAVFSGLRLDGVLSTKVRRDGANATARLVDCLLHSKCFAQLQVILLQGIVFAGFHVVDSQTLHETLSLPIIVVARHAPHFARIQKALLEKVPGGKRKWRLIENASPMAFVVGLYIQRFGISQGGAETLLVQLQQNGKLPEPLRVVHLNCRWRDHRRKSSSRKAKKRGEKTSRF